MTSPSTRSSSSSTENETLFKMHFKIDDQIKDNLKNLIMTQKGERLGYPDFGTNLRAIYSNTSLAENPDLIAEAGLGSWGLLFLLMGMTFLLGFFLDWVEITLIILPIFAPLVANLDFGDHVTTETGYEGRTDTLVWFLVLMALNLQTSFLTPPFGFALFYLKGVAPPEVKTVSIYRGVIPFVIIQLIGLGLVIWDPDIALTLSKF